MREHPILFSSEMVRAILEGRKTQTRRVSGLAIIAAPERYKFLRMVDVLGVAHAVFHDNRENMQVLVKSPYGKAGESLWVRETLEKREHSNGVPSWAVYRADITGVPYADGCKEGYCGHAVWQWKTKVLPAIHMPRWASRLNLEIVNVRVEQLQDISEDGAKAEGIYGHSVEAPMPIRSQFRWVAPGVLHTDIYGEKNYDAAVYTTARNAFEVLWDSINEERGFGWDKNPWVWCVEFKRIGEN